MAYDISDMFSKYILTGEDFELKSRTIIGRSVILTKVEAIIEDLGFDLLKTQLTGIISGVKEERDA